VSGKGDRLELVTLLDSRPATEFLEKTLVCPIDTFQLLLDRLTWQGLPMRVRRIFQNFYVVTHTRKAHIRQTVFIPLTLPLMEILVDLPHIVKQIANAYRVRLFPKRIFIGFHGISRIASLTFNQDRLGTDTPCSVLGCVPNAIVSLYYNLTLFVKFIS